MYAELKIYIYNLEPNNPYGENGFGSVPVCMVYMVETKHSKLLGVISEGHFLEIHNVHPDRIPLRAAKKIEHCTGEVNTLLHKDLTN